MKVVRQNDFRIYLKLISVLTLFIIWNYYSLSKLQSCICVLRAPKAVLNIQISLRLLLFLLLLLYDDIILNVLLIIVHIYKNRIVLFHNCYLLGYLYYYYYNVYITVFLLLSLTIGIHV